MQRYPPDILMTDAVRFWKRNELPRNFSPSLFLSVSLFSFVPLNASTYPAKYALYVSNNLILV